MIKPQKKRISKASHVAPVPHSFEGLSEAGKGRRKFLGRLAKGGGALAFLGLGAEATMQILFKRGVLSTAVADAWASEALPPPPVPSGTIYWVATDGDDSNAGTEAEPFATVQKAHDSLSAGDGIYVKAGTYPTRQLSWRKSDVILRGAPGATREEVILQNQGGNSWSGRGVLQFISNRVNEGDPPLENIHIYGLSIEGGVDARPINERPSHYISEGIMLFGYVRNWKLTNCIVRRIRNRGILSGSTGNYHESDFPHDIEVAYCSFTETGSTDPASAGADISIGERVGYVHVHHNELWGDYDGIVTYRNYVGSLIEYNEIHDHAVEDGVDLKWSQDANPLLPSDQRTIIRYNDIHDNDNYGVSPQMGTKRVSIYGNKVYNNGRSGFWTRPTQRDGKRCCTEDIVVEDNDIYGNGNYGISSTKEDLAEFQARNIKIINNRIYGNSLGGVRLNGGAMFVSGNVISHNGKSQSGKPQLRIDGSGALNAFVSNNNTFYLPDPSFSVATVDSAQYTLSDWRAVSGQDADSRERTGQYQAPTLPQPPKSINVSRAEHPRESRKGTMGVGRGCLPGSHA